MKQSQRPDDGFAERVTPRRRLPIAPNAPGALRNLPLADAARDVDRGTRPIYAVWELTLQCDLACAHCGSRAGHARPEELTTEQCLELARQMAELGIKEVTLIGGEAYLREDWLEVVAEVRRLGMDCTMTTGGRGLTAERAKAAASAGLMNVSVSLDGMQEAHDQLRGVPGSFASATVAMSHLRAAGIPVSVNTQLNRWSHGDLGELLELLGEQGVHGWQLQLTVPMGRAADAPEIMLQPYELPALFDRLAALEPRSRELGVKFYPGNNLGYFGPYEHLLRSHLPRGHGGSCGAGRSTLGIEADGTLKGCPSLHTAEWAGGNILEHSLRDVWERSEKLRFNRGRGVESLWGYCESCYYAKVCKGGCTWMSHSLFGVPGNNPYCHHRALQMQRAGKRESVVLQDPAPGAPFDRGLFRLQVEDLAATETGG